MPFRLYRYVSRTHTQIEKEEPTTDTVESFVIGRSLKINSRKIFNSRSFSHEHNRKSQNMHKHIGRMYTSRFCFSLSLSRFRLHFPRSSQTLLLCVMRPARIEQSSNNGSNNTERDQEWTTINELEKSRINRSDTSLYLLYVWWFCLCCAVYI